LANNDRILVTQIVDQGTAFRISPQGASNRTAPLPRAPSDAVASCGFKEFALRSERRDIVVGWLDETIIDYD